MKHGTHMTAGAAIALFLLAVTSAMSQTSVTINPTKDNTLYESPTGSLSNGAGEYMFVGNNAMGLSRRAILAFDIAGTIPAGAAIDSVKLTLNFSRTSSATQTISLHRVLADWGEGTSDAIDEEGSGELSTTNDATWTHTFYNTSFWTTTGGDYEPTASASRTVGNNSQYGPHEWGSTAEMTADVQDWLDNPSGNFGWILIGNEGPNRTSKRFDTRENANASNRPALTIFYRSIPCEDFTGLLARCVSNGTVQARVTLLNSTVHAGKTVEITVDSTVYQPVIVTNGTHSRAQVVIPGSSTGNHTVSLTDPADCFTPRVVTCAAGLTASDDEWAADDALWAGTQPDAEAGPMTTKLIGNYPNPFNPSTTVRYSLGEDSHVTITVFNTVGQEVVTLVDEYQPAGERSVVWDGKNASGADIAAGVYLLSLRTGTVTNVQKMIIIK
jgi:hypothetical protein